MKQRGSTVLKFADRYIGIPLIYLAGILKPLFRGVGQQQAALIRPHRIAIIKLAAIGDTVLLSGPLHSLRRAYPDSHISLFCGASNYEIAKHLSAIDDLIEVPITQPWRFLIFRGRGSFDLIFDFEPWSRISAMLSAVLRGRWKVGFRTDSQHRHYVFDSTAKHRIDIHEIENYQAILETVGIVADDLPELAPYAKPDDGAGYPSCRYLVFHLWAGGSRAVYKSWPLAHWISLARLAATHGLLIVFTGGKGDRSRNEEMIKNLEDVVRARDVSGLPFAELFGLLSRAACIISVDTGLMHIASALNAPLVALHGPTKPLRWGALSPRAIALSSTRKLPRYLDYGFESITDGGMDDISPADVWESVLKMISESNPTADSVSR